MKKNTIVRIVIYRRPMRTFGIIDFKTYSVHIEDKPTNHSVTKIQESIYHTEKSSQEYKRMV